MAKSIWDAHHDEKLHSEFDKKPEKDPLPTKRTQIVRGIDSALAALKEGKKAKANWYTTKDTTEGVRVKVSLSGTPLEIDGRTEGTVKNAVAFYEAAKKSVEAGDWDAAIRDAMEQSKSNRVPTASAAPSGEKREIKPELTHRRNVKRYGDERAMELLDKNVEKKGWNKDEVLAAYAALPPL